jgi:hypothetical protein
VNYLFWKLWLDDFPEYHHCIQWQCQCEAPELKVKFIQITFHVSNHNVSAVGLTCYLENVAKDDIKKVMKQASEDPWATLRAMLFPVAFMGTPTLSPSTRAGIVLNDHFVKLSSWYDNEFDCSNRAVNLMVHQRVRALGHQPQLEPKRKREALSSWGVPTPTQSLNTQHLSSSQCPAQAPEEGEGLRKPYLVIN